MRFLVATALLLVPALAGAELTLARCRQSAERDHPQVAASRARAAAARAREALAFSGFLPSLSGDATYSALRGAGGLGGARGGGTTTLLGPADVESVGVGLTARQTIWDFGRTLDGHAAAAASSRAARATLQAAREQLAVEAEAAYRTAFAADELVAAAVEAAGRAEKHLVQARARAEVGLRPRYDVTRAEVEVANAQLALVGAQNGRDLALVELASACGLDELPKDEPLEPPPPRAAPAATGGEELIERRPEVIAATEALAAAGEAEAAARAAYWPSLGAAGGLSYRGTGPEELGPGWTATLQLTVPILAGGADAARVREAEAGAELARASLDGVRRGARVELRAANLSTTEAGARVEAATKLEAAANEGLLLAEGRYETGLGDALEVADAQAALSSARATVVRARLDLAVARARLARLVGEGTTP